METKDQPVDIYQARRALTIGNIYFLIVELNRHQRYFGSIENTIESTLTDYWERVKENYLKSPKDDPHIINLMNSFEDIKKEEIEIGLMIFYYSLFNYKYNYFEYGINDLVEKIGMVENYKLKLSDLRGEGLFRATLYMKKVCKLNLEPLKLIWDEITIYNKIRNLITHNNGLFINDEKYNCIQEFVKNNNDIISLTKNRITFKMNFIIRTNDTFVNYLNELKRILDKKYPEGGILDTILKLGQ